MNEYTQNIDVPKPRSPFGAFSACVGVAFVFEEWDCAWRFREGCRSVRRLRESVPQTDYQRENGNVRRKHVLNIQLGEDSKLGLTYLPKLGA